MPTYVVTGEEIVLNEFDVFENRNELPPVKVTSPTFFDALVAGASLLQDKVDEKRAGTNTGFFTAEVTHVYAEDGTLLYRDTSGLYYDLYTPPSSHDPEEDSTHFSTSFISFSFKDRDFTEHLFRDLRELNRRNWFALQDLPQDRYYHSELLAKILREEIEKRDNLILILSKNSINSEWVKFEVETARRLESVRRKQVIIPVLADASIKTEDGNWILRSIRRDQILDFSAYRSKEKSGDLLEKLLRRVEENSKTDLHEQA